MILRRHYIAAFFLALLAFTSCVDDKFDDSANIGNSSNGNSACYLSLKIESINNSSQTRAVYTGNEDNTNAENGDFVHGGEGEHEIGENGNFVIFFDGDEKLFSIDTLKFDPGHKDNPGHNGDYNPDDYIETLYTTKFYPKEGVDEENKWPKSCLVILNGTSIYEQLKQNTEVGKTKLEEVLTGIWSSGDPKNVGRDGGRITMTNSVYSSDNMVHTAVEILPEHYTTDPDKKKELHVHVERMLSKFSFTTEKDTYDPTIPESEGGFGADPLLFFDGISEGSPDTIQYVVAKYWRIKVNGWSVNALESQSYPFKQISENDDWSDPRYFRSYWSEDPHYNDVNYDKYPWQYRSAIEKNNLDYYAQGQSPLTNYSYNDIVDETSEGGFNRVVYTTENTYGNNVINQDLDSRTNLLAGTHLLVCAQLEIKNEKTGEYESDGHHWYRDRNGLYYKSEKDFFVSFVHSLNHTLSSQRTMDYVLYDWAGGGKEPAKTNLTAKPENSNAADGTTVKYELCYTDATGNIIERFNSERLLEIQNMTEEQFKEKYDSLVKATVLHGDGMRLPWFEDENGKLLLTIRSTKGEKLKIYTRDIIQEKKGEGAAGYEIIEGDPVGDATDDDIRSLLYEWVGAVDHFYDGKMYYAAPVLHNGAKNPEKAEQTKLADYGVVRNNWYMFNLKDIKNIGTSIDDPAQPIVPDRIDINDVINVTINILDWHPITTGVPIL
ncbi:MAG: Mfa1 fimbrilin C-terminal domain-containing protein [Prevotella sp.]|nr:Mfa1 fimbrilin C-terminal domain-containing protein [Prevotella sp.]